MGGRVVNPQAARREEKVWTRVEERRGGRWQKNGVHEWKANSHRPIASTIRARKGPDGKSALHKTSGGKVESSDAVRDSLCIRLVFKRMNIEKKERKQSTITCEK